MSAAGGELSVTRRQRESAARAESTYAAAADHYLEPALGFWDRWGAATVARVPLAPGDAVLDVCCGAGASALPAARAVGPTGRVLGLDLAQPLLAIATRRAAESGLDNASFEACDATASGLEGGSFDAVLCVFGVFFAADMAGFVAEMWRLLRTGGTLAVTTWGPQWCEPASGVFWEAVGQLDSSLVRGFNPWDAITTTGALADLLAAGGMADSTVQATSGEYHELDRPEEFWDVVLGSGFRATVDTFDEARRAVLRRAVLDELRQRDVTHVHNDVVFGTAVKAST